MSWQRDGIMALAKSRETFLNDFDRSVLHFDNGTLTARERNAASNHNKSATSVVADGNYFAHRRVAASRLITGEKE